MTASVLDDLRQYAPFNAMEAPHLQALAASIRTESCAEGQVLLSPENGPPGDLFILSEGQVQGEQGIASAAGGEIDWQLKPGDCFPLGALLSASPVASVYRALSPCVVHRVPAQAFLDVKEHDPALRRFCTQRLARLLEASKRVIRDNQARSQPPLMDRLLGSMLHRDPVCCRPDTPIEEALHSMQERGIGSIIITDGQRHPLGIFTLHDVLGRVLLPRTNLAAPMSSVMSTGLETLPSGATAYEAALTMVRRGIRHVLVVDGGQLTGIVSEKDLFSLQRLSMRQLSSDIRRADSLDSLVPLAGEIRALADHMLVQGVSAEQLTQFIASLNDILTHRVVELEFATAELQGIELCWLALGSEGRGEQTLSTDQDNGIIFRAPPGMSAEAARALLLPHARSVNEALDACGFPLCKGDVMASNPRWCASLEEWRGYFTRWVDRGDPQALLHGSIFFDFRPLYGAVPLAQELRQWLAGHARQNPRFLHQMAANALNNRPPLGLIRDFAVDGAGADEGTVDLKLNGATLFVDAARIFSLASGGTAVNTAQRLRQAAPALNMPADEVEAWIEAFYYIQSLRLRRQHEQQTRGEKMGNRLNPYELHRLDRQILKEALRQARAIQERLALDWRA
jgi:CBS domain-containing protein